MNSSLPASPRVLVEADLQPVQGTRFQPTGFPDLGAAAYRLHDGTQMLLVESHQSVANRLEATAWDAAGNRLHPALEGLSYVAVVDAAGQPLTSSILEAHRLNSVYIENSDRFEDIRKAIGFESDKPLDMSSLVRTLARFDFNSLLHGVFLESIGGVLRIPRALSGFIEARDVSVVTSGGVKNDRVQAGTERGSDATAAQGYGNVPFHRDEYTAAMITAFFNVDLAQIRSYGLGDTAERLLYVLALWKIRSFLEGGLRLRTACDLDVSSVRVTRPEELSLPKRAELEAELRALIEQTTREGMFENPARIETRYAPKKGVKGKGRNKPETQDPDEEDA